MFKILQFILLATSFNIFGTAFSVSVILRPRDALHHVPISLRRSIVKESSSFPLWFTRLILILTTSPVGDERKWIHKIEKDTWKGVWIVPNRNSLKQAEDAALNSDLVVFYAHGGGYCVGHASMYMDTFQLIIKHLRSKHNIRASILSLEYSLSPEHVWPKAHNEAIEAYRYLTSTMGIPSSKIIFAGDSAGGNLAAAMLLTIKSQKQLSQPAGAALLSPWVDLTINQPSFARHGNDIVCRRHIAKYVPYYIPNYENLDEASRQSIIRNPQISPLYGNFSGTSSIFLSYAEKELLRTSIEDFKVNLENQRCRVTTLKGKNEVHVWLVSSLMATSEKIYERDCKIFIDWMASVCKKRRMIVSN